LQHRLYKNDGKGNFTIDTNAFPLSEDNTSIVIANDFDGDGDLDIATISFFADYNLQPQEGFVYLENKGDFKFIPFTLPETKSGRWLTMDAGDLNGDGKPDIVLGNCSFGPSIKGSVYERWKKGPPFLVLKNTGVKR
jgi:hypothetical protein